MKTISKRFLKASLAMLLVVMMLFSSTITGFAAVVDNAQTSADVDVSATGADIKGYIYYDNSLTKWSTVQILLGHGSWSQGYVMTRIANTDIWYYNMSNTWSGATQIAVFNASATWGGEGKSVSDRIQYMDKNSACKTFSTSYTSGLLLYGTSSSDNFTLSMSSKTYASLNANQTANVYSAAAGSSTFAADAKAGTVTVSGRYLSSATASTTRSASSTLNSTSSAVASLARGTTVTMTAAAADGYSFVGWYSGSTLKSSSATYTYTGTGSTATYTARFQAEPTYTATFKDWDGSVLDTQTGLKDGETPVAPANPTRDGYNFAGWDPTITAIDGADQTYTAQYQLAASCAPVMADLTLDVNGTGTVEATTNEHCTAGGTFSYSLVTPTDGIITLTGNSVTALKPGTTQVKATCACGKTVTCDVTVNTPDVFLTPETVKLIVGQTMTEAFATDADGNPEITISAGSTDVISISGNKATALKADTATVTASFKYNDSYTATKTATVTVSAPKITANPTSVALEFGEGATATSKTVTLAPNTSDGNGTGDDITVSSDNTNVATATVSGTTLTINATGIGSTTVKATFHGTTVEIPVTVTKYDPYVYLYVTDSQGWGNMYLHSWKGSNNNVTTLGQTNAQMIYIGRNGDDDKIFAYRFLKGSEPEKVIMVKTNSWPSDNLTRTDDFAVDFSKGYAALYIDSTTNSSGRRNTGVWTDDCMIVRPTVSVADVVVPVAGTETATATVENGGVVYWTMDDKTIATVADVTTATATVTGVTPGDTTITARAFVDTTKSSIKELPTNYKTDSTSWPFISTEATATVTVGSVDYDITAGATYSVNGTDYNAGTTGGTVSITVDGVNKGTSASVAHGKDYTLTATVATNYRFVGWYNGDELVTTTASHTVTAEAAAGYTAKFVRTCKISVIIGTGIELIKFNNVPYTENYDNITVDAGSNITVYASPATDYAFDKWTVSNGTVSNEFTTANITLTNVQESITLTSSAIPVYTATATAQTNKYFGTYGGTVTIDGQASPVQYKNGATATFEATNNTNYYFDGWYTDAEFTNKVSDDAEYQVTMTEEGITLYALFVKNFYLTSSANERLATFVYNVADNSYSVTADFTDHFTITSNDNNDVTSADVNVTGGNHTGCTVAGHYTSYQVTPDTENYDITAPVTYTLTPDLNTSGAADGTYTMNIALSDAEKVEISVNGTKVADKAIGSTFSYEITAPEGQYLSGATTAPAVDFEIVDGKIEFTVPDSNVNIVPDFANYSYVEISDTTGITVEGNKDGFKAGEEVTITLSPATDATTITNVVADYDGAVITPNGGNWTVTIASMPADTTITLTPTIDAKFKMDYGTVAIGNYGSGYTTYGTVSMKIGDTTLAKGGYAEPTDTVTYTAEPNANFIFDGWYSDAACSVGSLVSRNTSYDVTPTDDTTLYALFVPKHYIAEDQANVTTHSEMTYDPATRSFKYTSSTMNAGAWFRVSNNPTTSYWTDSSSYCIFDSSFNVTFNANAYMATVGWGTQCYALNVDASAIKPYEIIVALNGNSSIDVSCKAAKDGTHIYLSSGRVDVPGSYNSAAFDATTKFIDEDITNPEDVLVQNEGETREKYKKLKITEPRTVSFETTITGTVASNYEVDKFVVYHIEEERYEIVTPLTMGNNTYQGSVFVESDCYIVPIYFVTEAYATANNLAQIDIYFDATAIKDQAWGPFVACYAWGTNNAEYFGGWSAQLMIPSEDGTSFYTEVTVPAKGNTAAGIPNGVTFNNYTQSTVPGSNPGAFGISATQYQCYDYREPITLYESGYEVITFVAKDSTDGYHGDRANGVTANTVTSSTTDIFNKYDFDYLYCRDGKTPMDLNGDAIESGYAKLENGEKADYYIINKGDITYDPNGTKYVGDNNFDADWAVDWYIFDKDGKFLKNILSTAMWDDMTDSFEDGLYTYLHEALGVTAEAVAGKTVAISYEHENNAGHQVSYDGQWYGNMLDHKITADVKVGLIDGNQYFIDDDNIADYGEGYVIDVEGDGGKYQSVEISLDLGEVSLSANTTTDSYYFAGWYTYANGKYTQIGKSLDYTTYIDNNKTYYAMFREVGEDQVVFNHMVYNNPNDTVIPSHGGTSTMWIEIYEGTTLISKGTPSTSSSTAMIDSAVNGTTYTVKVYTTPLMNGEFFAWYTDSEDANGTKTYEEILTLDEHIDKTTTVESSFEYTYTYDAQKVTNIYSDVIRVSNKADLFFKYKNRYGEWRTYTVRDIELTDEECMGYEGNGGVEHAYYPTYLTKYVMENAAGTQVIVYGEDAMKDKNAEGYDVISSENNLQQYAPSSDVTEVFNGTVNWNIADTTIKPGKSMITIEADQGEPTYTIKYTAGTQSGTRTGVYNDLATIEPDAEYQGATFSHWEEKDKESGEWVFLTYNKRYSYRIVEDKEIRAVYGDKLTDEWVPSIDSVTYTREYQDTSDVIYTDFLLAYNSKTGVKLNDVKDAQSIKYGLLMVMDPNYRYDGNGDVKYLEPTEANLITAAEYGKNKLIDGIRYYNFDLTSLTLTNFNRCDYFKSFDNRDTTNNYKGVAYTCYAYLIKDGKVYLSNPENVNFYELAMEDVTSSN